MAEKFVTVMTLEGRAGMHICGAVEGEAENGKDALLTGAELLIEMQVKDSDGYLEEEDRESVLDDVKASLEKCKGGYEAGSDEFLFLTTHLSPAKKGVKKGDR